MSTEPKDESSKATRQLGLIDVTAIVVGGIIGVGIFFTPASIAKVMPSPLWMMLIWGLGGFIALLGALVLAELGGRLPESGGVYVFLRRGLGDKFGPMLAFLYAWVNLLIVQPGALAIIAWVFVINLEMFTGPTGPILHIGIQISVIVLFAVANCAGLMMGAGIQRWVTLGKLLAVLLLVLLGLWWGQSANVLTAVAEPVADDVPSGVLGYLVAGLIPVLFSFGGWQHGTFVAGVVKDPQSTVPRGIFAGMVVVVVAYLTINLAYLGLMGQAGMATAGALAAEAASVALGDLGGSLVAGIIMLSAAGIINTILLAFPYVIYAMSKDGLFIESFGELNPRTETPVRAIALPSALACVAVFLGSDQIDSLLAGVTFGEWAFFALVSVAFFGVRRLEQRPPVFVVHGAVAVLFGLSALAVALGALWLKPSESLVGVGVMAAGVVLYWVRQRNNAV